MNYRKAFTSCQSCLSLSTLKCRKCLLKLAIKMDNQIQSTSLKPQSNSFYSKKQKPVLQAISNYQRYIESRTSKRVPLTTNSYRRKVNYDVDYIDAPKFQRWNRKIENIMKKSAQRKRTNLDANENSI